MITLLFMCFASSDAGAQNDPDYPESLGRCLGVYKIKSKTIPGEFTDFDYFYFDNFPGQDADQPQRDSENRVFIRGKIKLKNEKTLPIKKAFVRIISVDGDEDNYKDIYFETEESDGLSYQFTGEFLEKWIEDEDGFTKVKGTLKKFKNGRKIAEVKLSFYEYAEL